MLKGVLSWLPEPIKLRMLKKLAKKAQRQLTAERSNLGTFMQHHPSSRLVALNVPENRAVEAIQLLNAAHTYYTSAHISLNRLFSASDIHSAARHSTTSTRYVQKGVDALTKAQDTLSPFGITI